MSNECNNENTENNRRVKRARLDLVGNAVGFINVGSSFNNRITWYYKRNATNILNYSVFLNSVKSELIHILKSTALPIKFNLKLEAVYNKPMIENSSANRAFKTSARAIFNESDIEEIIDEMYVKILTEEDEYQGKGSGFTLETIDGLLLGVYKYTPMGGSSYIELPKDIMNKKAVINPHNSDNQCFKWAILSKHVIGVNKQRVAENYFIHEYRYNFSGISYPTPSNEIKIFEKNNNVSVNIYGLKKMKDAHHVFPLRVVEEKTNHFDLLLLKDNNITHYTYISNFSRLVRAQKTLHKESVIFCKRCFTTFDNRQKNKFEEHTQICGEHKPILPIMPMEGDTLEFDAWSNTQRLPFVLYADFEALLLNINEAHGSNTTAIQSHIPMSFGLLVKATDDVPVELLNNFDIPLTPIVFRGSENSNNVARQFVLTVVEIAEKLYKLLKTINIPIMMTEEEQRIHAAKTKCDLCKIDFTSVNHKVAHHNHLSGKFIKSLCNTCNLKLKTQNFVPCFLHNLSKYDAHFIITELGYDSNTIRVIPNSEENFISFSKYISNDFKIRFIDTYRFLASKLSTLAENLLTTDFSKFRETAKVFTHTDMHLVTRKGVYPYCFTDSWEKLKIAKLPRKEHFYNILTETDIEEKEYEHAKRVWNHFGCRSLGEYSDLYLKIDVLLLADVFENFRDICISTYKLDPAFYYTAPGFSFDCMLKYTSIKLELLSDYDMLLMIEKGDI